MTKKANEECTKDTAIDNVGRRQAVKTLVGSVTAVAAYNMLPAKWGVPVIDTVFLPVQAATSGITLNDPCTVSRLSGDQTSSFVVIRVSGFVTPAVGSLPTTIVVTPLGVGSAVTISTTTAVDGTFSEDILLTGGPGITGANVVTVVTGASGVASCGDTIPASASGSGL